MANNLHVAVTADITDLTTRFAIARAETSALSAEFNKLARATAAGTIDAGGSARFQQLAGDMVHAKTQAQSLGVALGQASGGVLGISSSLEHAHGSISTATREVRALFDELSSGRTRQTPGTIAILLTRVLGLGPAALGAVVGTAALAAGLAYLAVRSIEAKNALDQMEIGAKFAGNLEVSREALEQFSTELAKSSRISASEAREIVGAFASMHNLSTTEIHALESVIDDFAQATGQKATEAKAALEKAFSDKESAAAYARSLGGVSQALINSAEMADRSGNAQAIFAEKFEILNSVLDRSRGAIDKHNESLTSSIRTWLQYFGVVSTANGIESGQQKLIEDTNAARAKQIEQLEQLRAEMAAAPPPSEQTLKVGVSTAEKENPVAMQVEEAKSKIGEMNAALSIAIQHGDDLSVEKLNAGLGKAKEQLAALQFGPVLERMREQMQQVAAVWDGTQSGLLSKQIAIGQATLAQVQGNSKEELAVKQEVARLEVQLRRETGTEIIAEAKSQIQALTADTTLSAIERSERERDAWIAVLANDRVVGAQRLEAAREFNSAYAAIQKETFAQAQAIARSDSNTAIEISKLKLAAAKSSLDAEVAATQAAVAAKYQALKALATQEFALDQQMLQSQLDSLKPATAAYEEMANKIRVLEAKLTADLAVLDRQQAADSNRAAKEQATEWQKAVGEIENAESGLVSDLLNKRKTLSQSLLAIGAQLVSSEISNDLKAFTTKVALQNNEKALEQGGLLFHLISQATGADATVKSQAAQTAAQVSGDQARVASQATAASEGKAAQAAVNSSTILADAGRAAAGAYAALAGVPIIGPIIAPAAAAIAYGAVAAFESLDTGTNYVPADMPAMLHQGEAIVPKQYNPAAGGDAMMAGGDTHNHVHLNMNLSAFDSSGLERLVHSDAFRSHLTESVQQHINRGNRFR